VLACWAYTGRISPRWFYLVLLATGIPAVITQDLRGITTVSTAGIIYYVGVTNRLTTWLSGPVFQFFGKISYSMYLIHMATGILAVNVLWKFVEPTPANALLLAPVALIGCILGSILLYTLIERPSVAISQRLKKPK
jgi:peptidoglycan/LPS O-acetylase OafA/YrhL